MPNDSPSRPRHALANLTRPLCVIDSEWTGPSPADARLISLAVHKLLPGGAVEQREWFVNPETTIDPGSGAVHGITDAQAASWPPFRAVAAEVAAFLEGADIGGYSVSSDIQILEVELAHAGCELRTADLRVVDPLRLWQKREPRKLTDAYERFVGPVPEELCAHDAGDDVRMTLAVIEAMAGGGPPSTSCTPRATRAWSTSPGSSFATSGSGSCSASAGTAGIRSTRIPTSSTGCSAGTSRRPRWPSPAPSCTASSTLPPSRRIRATKRSTTFPSDSAVPAGPCVRDATTPTPDRLRTSMLNRDDMRMMLGVGAIIAAISAGTCSTNGRIDDVHPRIDDVNTRMTEGFDNLNRRIDNLDADVRELRTLLFESVKQDPAAD